MRTIDATESIALVRVLSVLLWFCSSVPPFFSVAEGRRSLSDPPSPSAAARARVACCCAARRQIQADNALDAKWTPVSAMNATAATAAAGVDASLAASHSSLAAASTAIDDASDVPVAPVAAAGHASAAASSSASGACLPPSLAAFPLAHKLPSSLPKFHQPTVAQKGRRAKESAAGTAAASSGGSKAAGPARVSRQTQLNLPRRQPTPLPQTAMPHAAQQRARAQQQQQQQQHPQHPPGAALAGSKRPRPLQPSQPFATAHSSGFGEFACAGVEEIETDDVQVVEPHRQQPRYTREPLQVQGQPIHPPAVVVQPPMLGPLPMRFGPSVLPPPPVQWQNHPPDWPPAAAYGRGVQPPVFDDPLTVESQMAMQRLMQQPPLSFDQLSFQTMQLQTHTAMTQRVYGPQDAAYAMDPQVAAVASSSAVYAVPSHSYVLPQQPPLQRHQHQQRQQPQPQLQQRQQSLQQQHHSVVPVSSLSQLPPPQSASRPQPYPSSASALTPAPQRLVGTKPTRHCHCASPVTPSPPRHLLQPHYLMKERLLTVVNPQWNDWRGEGIQMQAWEIDETVATVEEKTRRALPSETRIGLFGSEAEMDLREKVRRGHTAEHCDGRWFVANFLFSATADFLFR